MSRAMSDAPTILREGMYRTVRAIADYCGLDTAQELVRVFGGTRIWVPCNWRADLALNRIGEARARAIVAAYGNSSIDVPRQLLTADGRAHVIDRLAASGLSQAEIARAIGCSQRTVSRIQRSGRSGIMPSAPRPGRRVDPRQIDLEDLL